MCSNDSVRNRCAAELPPPPQTAFGTVFHSVMALLDLSRDPLHQLEALGSAGTIPKGMLERVRSGVVGLWGSRLFPALDSAPIALREQSFSLRLDGAVLTGTIDLLLRTAGGEWRIVDYKTDRVDEAMVERRAGQYRLQVEAYAYACGRILGLPVSSVLIYFVRPNVWWEGVVTRAGMEAVESELARLVGGIRSANFTPRRSAGCRRCVYDGVLCR